MNILTYIPIPMPIVVHGGGGGANVPSIASMCIVGSLCIAVVVLLFIAFALVAATFEKVDIAELMMKALVVAIALCLLTLSAGIFCGILGV